MTAELLAALVSLLSLAGMRLINKYLPEKTDQVPAQRTSRRGDDGV